MSDLDRTVRGLGASPGTAEGPLRLVRRGEPVGSVAGAVLCVDDPAFCELAPIREAAALVLLHAGSTSEGAIVARGFGKACVVGFPEFRIAASSTSEANAPNAPNAPSGMGLALVARDGRAFPDGTQVQIDGARGLITFC